MFFLSSTTDKVEVVTTNAASLAFATFYGVVDKTSAPAVIKDFDSKIGTISSATTTDLTGSPAGSNDRWSVRFNILNKDAVLAAPLTVRYVKAGTAKEVILVTLYPGESLSAGKDGVLRVKDATGADKTALTAPLSTSVLTSGTGATYTTPAGCRALRVRMKGAGGGGGGGAGTASDTAAGGGGGEGGETTRLIINPASSYTYTVGAKGTGGAAGNNAGAAGGDTLFSTLTAKGGSGGAGMAAATTLGTTAAGGAGGVAGSGGDLNLPGQNGRAGIRFSGTLALSGDGAGHGAGQGSAAAADGASAATSSGSGGGGGLAIGATARKGGDGGDGFITVEELF